ncbi:MAG: matrixin family metalloprotease [Isosphaeraceae bacterium]
MFPVYTSKASMERRPMQRQASARARVRPRVMPVVEDLEARVVLYSASGNLWAHPELVTISFMPDGTNFNGSSSNLFATFNARFGSASAWQNIVLKAAQVWAQQTNINFAVVSDNGSAVGSGSNQQGDSGFGDIRIGGYNLGATALAMAYSPPTANNYSVAGDVAFNTTKVFSSGSGNDLFTIATHEIGHALGLLHSTVAAAQMYSTYNGVKPSLNADDVAGIRSIYSGGTARTADAYNTGGNSNSTLNTAADVTSVIDTTNLTGVVPDLDITTAGQKENFTFTAPAGTNGTLNVVVQSSGLSLLAPKVTVYAADKTTVLGSANGLNKYGTTLTVTLTGVTAGTRYYVQVQGADNTAFGTGAYAVALNFGANPNPTISTPNTTTPNGNPLVSGGGIADTLPPAGSPDHDHDHAPGPRHRRGVANPAARPKPSLAPSNQPKTWRVLNGRSVSVVTAAELHRRNLA